MQSRLKTRLNRLASLRYDSRSLVKVPALRESHFDQRIKEGQTNMDVSGIGSVSGATPIRGVSPAVTQPTAMPSVAAPRDELEISSAGKMLDRLSETPEVRAERLAQIKHAIENGAYDTDEKLEAALSRMFDSLETDSDE